MLRHPECKARCDPIEGYQCKKCGKCDIGTVCKAADEYGFRVFVIPGGSFVKKILKVHRPQSCIGVACHPELSESMQGVAAICRTGGMSAAKDGCFNTEADVEAIIKKWRSPVYRLIGEIVFVLIIASVMLIGIALWSAV
jgi:hypothetical protein